MALEAEAVAEQKASVDKLQASVNELLRKVEQLQLELTSKRESHRQELHRAQTSDPHRCAMRRRINEYLAKFKVMEEAAGHGQGISAKGLYTLESEAHDYIKRHLPAHDGFEADFPIERA
jgi:hypothetical protein